MNLFLKKILISVIFLAGFTGFLTTTVYAEIKDYLVVQFNYEKTSNSAPTLEIVGIKQKILDDSVVLIFNKGEYKFSIFDEGQEKVSNYVNLSEQNSGPVSYHLEDGTEYFVETSESVGLYSVTLPLNENISLSTAIIRIADKDNKIVLEQNLKNFPVDVLDSENYQLLQFQPEFPPMTDIPGTPKDMAFWGISIRWYLFGGGILLLILFVIWLIKRRKNTPSSTPPPSSV